MLFDIYKITSKELLPHVQYILFNHSRDNAYSKVITSFANTNICLGIINQKKLVNGPGGVKGTEAKNGIYSYLSGMYLAPHKFEASGSLDEICIDFTPLGYYHFFRLPLKTYIIEEDVLTETWGAAAKPFFEAVFSVADLQKRGALIEAFLLKRFINHQTPLLQECLYDIHNAKNDLTLKQLAKQLRCSEKKVVRAFLARFDLTPKDYLRIVKFRRTLQLLHHAPGENLTSVAHQSGYYDQSHFIKDIRFFTEKSPKEIRAALHNVKQHVIIGLE